MVLALKKFTVKWGRKLHKVNCKAAPVLQRGTELHPKSCRRAGRRDGKESEG